MRLVVADTAPLNYLVLIGQVDLLSALFGTVFIPEAVRDELRHAQTPKLAREWIAEPPKWIEIVASSAENVDAELDRLDEGERAAILVALRIRADLLLMDDREGVRVARSKGFAVTGTLGVLDLAANRGMIALADTLERLKATNFRCRPEIMEALLARHANAKGGGQ
jgi:predicted nucleic acid-binding protein